MTYKSSDEYGPVRYSPPDVTAPIPVVFANGGTLGDLQYPAVPPPPARPGVRPPGPPPRERHAFARAAREWALTAAWYAWFTGAVAFAAAGVVTGATVIAVCVRMLFVTGVL